MQNLTNKKISYPTCQKEGMHLGEPINHKCMERKCENVSLLCSFCIEESHKKHKVLPIKVIFSEAQQKIIESQQQKDQQQSDNQQIQLDPIIKIINEQKKVTLTQLGKFQKECIEQFKEITVNLEFYYDKIIDELKEKSDNIKNMNNFLQTIYSTKFEEESLQKTLNKLLEFAPINQTTIKKQNQETLLQENTNECQKINDFVGKKQNQIFQAIKDIQLQIEIKTGKKSSHQIDNQSILGNEVQSETLKTSFGNMKHPQIQILNKQEALSLNQEYKFALLNEQLDLTKESQFIFKTINNPGNWIAVGVCHKSIVEQNNYNFTLQKNHGSYMVASNKVQFSHSSIGSNNIPMAFTYSPNELIKVTFNPLNKKITFLNMQTKKKQTLNFKITPNTSENIIHPCIVLYHKDTQVQLINQ